MFFVEQENAFIEYLLFQKNNHICFVSFQTKSGVRFLLTRELFLANEGRKLFRLGLKFLLLLVGVIFLTNLDKISCRFFPIFSTILAGPTLKILHIWHKLGSFSHSVFYFQSVGKVLHRNKARRQQLPIDSSTGNSSMITFFHDNSKK